MTMFPAHLSSSNCVNINGGFSEGGYHDCFISLGRGFVSDLMAEDQSITETSTNNDQEEAGSSSKDININADVNDDHGHWLQLSLGGGGGHIQNTTSHLSSQTVLTGEMEIPIPPSIVTLDLLTGGGGASTRQQAPPPPPQLIFQVPEFQGRLSTAAMSSVPFMTLQQLQLQQQQQQDHQQHQQQEQQETNYNYLHLIRPLNPPVSSSSSFSGSSEQHGRPLHVHRRLNVARVVNPPRRPHSGIWFVLQASQNQSKEPFLPQIPKSYMRIKDGRMTVGLLIKYLVNKLDLGSESEVEITCKGHQLLSLLTLQHVRDAIWNNPRNDVGFSVAPRSSATINHLMVLNYGRIA